MYLCRLKQKTSRKAACLKLGLSLIVVFVFTHTHFFMVSLKNMNDGNKPATKADVAKVSDDVGNLAIAAKNTFDRIETKLTTLEKGQVSLRNDVAGLKKGQVSLRKGQASLKENQERILFIVESIDEHFKEFKELPGRVKQLEVDVFKLQTRQ